MSATIEEPAEGTALRRASDLLFPQDGSGRTRNIHFFVPEGASPTAEQLAEQVLWADEQIRTGQSRLVENVDGD